MNNQTTTVTVTSTRFSKEKAAKLGRGGALLDLIRPAHCGLLIILGKEDKGRRVPVFKPIEFSVIQ